MRDLGLGARGVVLGLGVRGEGPMVRRVRLGLWLIVDVYIMTFSVYKTSLLKFRPTFWRFSGTSN